MTQVLTKYSLEDVCFDGCAFGLKSRAGGLMKKPWRVCTNDTNILKNFKPFVCSNTGCTLTDHSHDLCHGIDCKESENYTFQMTRLVHKSFRETQKNISRDRNSKACTSSINNKYEFEMCDCKICFPFARAILAASSCRRALVGFYRTLHALCR